MQSGSKVESKIPFKEITSIVLVLLEKQTAGQYLHKGVLLFPPGRKRETRKEWGEKKTCSESSCKVLLRRTLNCCGSLQ